MGVISRVTEGEIFYFFIRSRSVAVRLTVSKLLSQISGWEVPLNSYKLVISRSKPLQIDQVFQR